MARTLLQTFLMQPITSAQLDLITGGAGGTNNLNAWLPQGGGGGGAPGGGFSGGGGSSGGGGASGGFGPITPADNRAVTNPSAGPQPRESMASGPNSSWQQGLPGMFSAMGM